MIHHCPWVGIDLQGQLHKKSWGKPGWIFCCVCWDEIIILLSGAQPIICSLIITHHSAYFESICGDFLNTKHTKKKCLFRRTKSNRPEGPKAGPKSCHQEIRGPEGPYTFVITDYFAADTCLQVSTWAFYMWCPSIGMTQHQQGTRNLSLDAMPSLLWLNKALTNVINKIFFSLAVDIYCWLFFKAFDSTYSHLTSIFPEIFRIFWNAIDFICEGHTAWKPEGREGQSQKRPYPTNIYVIIMSLWKSLDFWKVQKRAEVTLFGIFQWLNLNQTVNADMASLVQKKLLDISILYQLLEFAYSDSLKITQSNPQYNWHIQFSWK